MSGLRTSVLLLFSIVFYVVTTPLTTNAAVSHYHDDATTPPVLKDSSPAVMPSAFWLDSTAHLTPPITYDEFRFAATSIVIPPHGVGFAPFPQPQINSTLRPRPPPADASTTNFVFSIAAKKTIPGAGLSRNAPLTAQERAVIASTDNMKALEGGRRLVNELAEALARRGYTADEIVKMVGPLSKQTGMPQEQIRAALQAQRAALEAISKGAK